MSEGPRAELCRRAMVELVFLVAHQRRARGRQRRDWTLLWALIRDGLSAGASPEEFQHGPWQVGQRPLTRPGRNGLRFIPLAVRGGTEILLTTAREAEELVGFLNWCGAPEFGSR